MPAAPPGVLSISTITDANGQVLVRIEIDYNSATGALTGASATNNTGKPIKVSVYDDAGALLRSAQISPGTSSLTANQLSKAGFSTAADCNGLTFDVS